MNRRTTTPQPDDQQDPKGHETWADYCRHTESTSGLNYDPDRPECKAFKREIGAIQRIGHNHGLDEGQTLVLINHLYQRRGIVWEKIRWDEMQDIKNFVKNNHHQIDDALKAARGYAGTVEQQRPEPRTEW